MTQDRWQRIKQLFSDVCDLPASERDAHLLAQESDPEILNTVRQLLQSDSASTQLISPLRHHHGDLEPGARLGPYRIICFLDEGGMGSVYLAERSDGQFQQRVAIKTLRRGSVGAQPLADAPREQRMLARLNHPNIARIIDAGIDAGPDDRGLPFIVMEYVEGTGLLDHCNSGQLTLAQRLALFVKICAAVEHAHQNLVLHRDLKPDNILVAADGEPKLLDFGIAKLLQESTGAVAPGTATIQGWSALTPEYASPEQIRGEPLSTATDVYALGVILYELLSGQRPYAFDKRSPEEVVRVVTDAPIIPPSQRSAGLESAPVPARALRGDLDTIVAQAMHRDRHRRYASVLALAQDVENFRRNRPVSARADTTWYRMRKFVQRQRLPVAIAALSLLLVCGGAAFAWLQSQARWEEARKAQALNQFVLSLFDSVTPTERQGGVFSVAQLLQIGSQRALTELAEEPEVLQLALLKIAETHIALGDLEQAQTVLNMAREHGRFEPNSSNDIDASALEAWLDLLAGRGAEAVQSFEQVLARLQRYFPQDKDRRGVLQTRLAKALIAENRPDEAQALLVDAIDLLSRAPAQDPRAAQEGLAEIYLMRGDLARARDALRAIIASSPLWDDGRETMALADHHHALALNLTRSGDFDGADTHADQALGILRRLDAVEHPSFARALALRTFVSHVRGEPEEALEAADAAIDLLARLRPQSSEYRQALGMRADVLKGLGRHQEAISAFKQAAQEWRSSDGSDRGRGLATTLLSQASTEYWAGQFEDSLNTIDEAVRVLAQSGMARDHRPRYNLALRMGAHAVQVLVAMGQAEQALLRAKQLDFDHPEIDESDSIQLQARFILSLWRGAALERLGNEHQAAQAFALAEHYEGLSEPGMISGEREALMRFRASGSPLE